MMFGSLVALPTRHLSRATLTSRLGCLGRTCSLSPLPSYPMSPICKLQDALTLSARHLSQAILACCLGCLGGGARVFSSLLAALVIHLSSVLDFAKACIVSFFRHRELLCIFLGECWIVFIIFSISSMHPAFPLH